MDGKKTGLKTSWHDGRNRVEIRNVTLTCTHKKNDVGKLYIIAFKFLTMIKPQCDRNTNK